MKESEEWWNNLKKNVIITGGTLVFIGAAAYTW